MLEFSEDPKFQTNFPGKKIPENDADFPSQTDVFSSAIFLKIGYFAFFFKGEAMLRCWLTWFQLLKKDSPQNWGETHIFHRAFFSSTKVDIVKLLLQGNNCTLPKLNSLPLKDYHPKRKQSSSSSHHFSVVNSLSHLHWSMWNPGLNEKENKTGRVVGWGH